MINRFRSYDTEKRFTLNQTRSNLSNEPGTKAVRPTVTYIRTYAHTRTLHYKSITVLACDR